LRELVFILGSAQHNEKDLQNAFQIETANRLGRAGRRTTGEEHRNLLEVLNYQLGFCVVFA
jgi:hypothetical protein